MIEYLNDKWGRRDEFQIQKNCTTAHKKKKRHGVLSPHLSHVSCTLFSDFSLPPCCDQNDTASVVLLSVTHNYNMTMGTWAFDSPLIEGHSAKTLTSIPQNCRGY
jgi:hypothetical protein